MLEAKYYLIIKFKHYFIARQVYDKTFKVWFYCVKFDSNFELPMGAWQLVSDLYVFSLIPVPDPLKVSPESAQCKLVLILKMKYIQLRCFYGCSFLKWNLKQVPRSIASLETYVKVIRAKVCLQMTNTLPLNQLWILSYINKSILLRRTLSNI